MAGSRQPDGGARLLGGTARTWTAELITESSHLAGCAIYHSAMDRALLDRSLEYVDSWLEWRCRRTELPGCAVSVSLKGKILLSAAYGQFDLESGRRLAPDGVFRIASHSKSFTATALMQLVERGRLRLDEPVSAYLTWMARHADRRFRRVTVRQLLCHGAGVTRDSNDADFWQMARPFPDAEELRQLVLAGQLVTDANVAFKYSNIGYGLLGLLVEEVAGQSYRDYTEEHIVAPLGLEATVAEPSAHQPKAVTGYTRRGGDGLRRPVPPVDTRALAPATGFASSAPDLCRYFSAHFVGSRRLLSDEAKREMQRVHWRVHRPAAGEQDYGLGLMLQRLKERQAFGHGGAFPGQISHTLAVRGDGLVVTALTSCIDGPASEIVRGVYGVIDHFQNGAGKRTLPGLRTLEGRYANLWSIVDLVVAGDQISAGQPDSWAPLEDPDRLAKLGSRKLMILDTSGYGSSGEEIDFEVKDGEVISVRWGGTTCWPESSWSAVERRLLGRPGRAARRR